MLNDTQVRNAKGGQRPIKLSDSGGLYLLLMPNGSKLWRLAYRFGGKQKSLALGTYPTITLKQARERRDAAKKLLVDKIDPSIQRRIEKQNARANSMCCRSTSIACMSKIVGALVRCKRFYEFSNQPPEFLHSALGAFAQRSFEFRERHLDGIEVWRICRQIAECCTDSVDCLAYPVDLVGPQIIREHDVAFCQRWREHLLDIGHERA